MNHLKEWITVASLLLLTGCQTEKEIADCPYQDRQETPANAGCLITQDGKVAVVTQRLNGKYNLPGGTSDSDETSSCTAMRETAEETGHQVSVGELLQEFDNGFRLYACTSENPTEAFAPTNTYEIASVQWLKPEQIHPDQWRFPKHFERQMELIQQQTANK
ncbi:NUDIX hydrolase [Endozoicomonas arenosclerae]|uniref:NUDIX hydrolase n=1 Tax=Endozoicomonas arenosclerae TaxID=1633495 RepID=UPI000785CA2B|nr:NUDIX hydrolase [Endozoicomonas arenosclerae]